MRIPKQSCVLVIALGGNAILQPGQLGTFEEQLMSVDAVARSIVALVRDGYRIVVTHGNGPQVGNILIQNKAASHLVSAMPMDACGAESQGLIGYMLLQCLKNHLQRMRIKIPVCVLLTQTEVSGDDPAFLHPSKPVGPFYDADRARQLSLEKGYAVHEDAGRGWRRVVASPVPVTIVEKRVIRNLVSDGTLVVCSGGGGIPVLRGDDGSYRGVEAVIDKDLAASQLAIDVKADLLLILTDVTKVYLGYGSPQQRALDEVGVGEMEAHARQNHFKAGSMGPKVEAALRFAWRGGTSIIAGLSEAESALAGQAGTRIVPQAAVQRCAHDSVVVRCG